MISLKFQNDVSLGIPIDKNFCNEKFRLKLFTIRKLSKCCENYIMA